MIKFDLNQLKASLNATREKVSEARRPAAQAAAEVIYQEARLNAPVKTGKLRSAIYQVHSEDNSGETKTTYHIGVNRRKAPHAHLVEFGTSRAPAHPFLGKAVHEKGTAALQAMRRAFIQRVKA